MNLAPGDRVRSLDFTSDRAVALWTAVIERVHAAIIDHGCAEFIL